MSPFTKRIREQARAAISAHHVHAELFNLARHRRRYIVQARFPWHSLSTHSWIRYATLGMMHRGDPPPFRAGIAARDGIRGVALDLDDPVAFAVEDHSACGDAASTCHRMGHFL